MDWGQAKIRPSLSLWRSMGHESSDSYLGLGRVLKDLFLGECGKLVPVPCGLVDLAVDKSS